MCTFTFDKNMCKVYPTNDTCESNRKWAKNVIKENEFPLISAHFYAQTLTTTHEYLVCTSVNAQVTLAL